MIPKFSFLLTFQHRGMGDSSLTLAGDEEITIELLARDLLFLLEHLGWEEIALCGHSMGGMSPQHRNFVFSCQVMLTNA